MNKSKIFMMVSIMILLISLVGSVGTYAWFTWKSTNNTSLTLTIGKLADVTFDTGNNINTNSLSPVFNYTDGEITTFRIINKSSTLENFNYVVSLKIDNIDIELSNDCLRYKLFKNGTEVGSGSFLGTKSGDTINLTEDVIEGNITDFSFYLYIDGNMENNSSMMNKNLTGTLMVSLDSGIKSLTNYISDLYGSTTKTIVTNNSIEYNTAPEVSLMNDRLGGTTTSLDGGNIRYYGANPNNYIYFNCEEYPDTNCELWRIIGVFDDKVKIIRNESIGNYSWDTAAKAASLLTQPGVNEWSQADAMKLLNSGYESESVGGSLYYNSGAGTCYNGTKNATTSCDFTNTGIKNDTTRSKIAEVVWNTGGCRTPGYANESYEYERGTETVSDPADKITRTTSWNGKIALAYPSDYGYATDFNNCSLDLTSYNDNEKCYTDNWLYPIIGSNSYGWLLTPHTAFSYDALVVAASGVSNGGVTFGYITSRTYKDFNVVPTLFLDSSEIIVNGTTGTIDNPYKLAG